MKNLSDDPKELKYKGILVGLPTFGMVSINFAIALKTATTPIFSSMSMCPVVGKPVDVARNEIAMIAINSGHSFVWFMDDDVHVPPESGVKLLGRFSAKQLADPREVAEAIVGGVVYSKIAPPSPMIYRYGAIGGFEDWSFGDLVEAESIGMGCAMIPVGVFKAILKTLDKFQCVNDSCPVKWTVVHKEAGNCPTCGVQLAPIFFKTVRAGEGLDWRPIEMTEDTYFCFQARDAGVKVYADCSVQCKHECTETGRIFYFHEGLGVPVWEGNGQIDYWPKIPDYKVKGNGDVVVKKQKKTKDVKATNGKVKFNLGSGGVHKKGYINIDLYTDCDFRCDIRKLAPAVARFGQADEITADHVLEHVNRTAVTATVRNWLKALKPGGKLIIEVPDATAAMKEFLEADKNGTKQEAYDFKEAVVFGGQRYEGDEHQTAITRNKIERVLESCSNMIEKSSIKVGRFKGHNQDEIVVRVTKKKPKKEVSVK